MNLAACLARLPKQDPALIEAIRDAGHERVMRYTVNEWNHQLYRDACAGAPQEHLKRLGHLRDLRAGASRLAEIRAMQSAIYRHLRKIIAA